MIKKTVTYIDYDDVERIEDCYFNLTKAELAEMEMSTSGGMKKMLEQIIQEQDQKKLLEIFKEIFLKSYGKKSPDGRRFIKTPELRQEFEQTEAYSELFTELAFDAKAMAAFVNGIIPQQALDQAKAAATASGLSAI